MTRFLRLRALLGGVRRVPGRLLALGACLRRGARRARDHRGLATVLALALAAPFLVSPPREPVPAEAAAVQVDVAPEASQLGPGTDAPPGQVASAPEAPAGGQPPAAHPSRPPIADAVEPIAPDLIVRPKKVDPSALVEAVAIDGVQHLAGAGDIAVEVEAPVGRASMRLLVVDPVAFRPLTPDPTAKTREVWERLVDGELVVRHDVAQKLQLPLGGTVNLLAGETRRPTRVGAFASNGTPPLADAIVSWEVGADLGASQPNVLVVAVAEGRSADEVGARMRDTLGGAELTAVEPPEEQRARLVGTGSTRFEPFSYIDYGDGMISIDPAWVRRNIASFRLPIFGGVARCHRVMGPQLVAALEQVQREGLARYIDRADYGGCWVPRHILFDPNRPLSMHAWGLAVDFNVRTNQYGAAPRMHPRIVEIFQQWGFAWGGHWSTPDGMHFELRTVIR